MHNIKPMINSSFDIKPWRIVIFAVLLITILKGIRFPNMWSYSHFLFNYDHGLIKRGLIGEIIGQFNNPYLNSYEFFLIFSITIFSINIILLSFLIRDLINSQNPTLIGLTLVFVSSLAIVFLSHTVGYFDHLGLLIALTTIKISGFYKKMCFLLFFMPFALLIHEAILIIFYPIIFMSLLFSIDTEGRIKKFIILGAFSVVLLILVAVITNHTLTKSEAYDMYSHLQTKVVHPLRQDAFDVLIKDSKANFNEMKIRWSSKQTIYQFAVSLLVTAPSFLVFIYFIILILKKAKVDFYLIMFSIFAAISPLLMHFLGADIHRWNTLTVTTSLLMFYIVFTKNKNQPITASGYLFSILVFVIFLNGTSSIYLLDGYYVKQFPFFDHLKYIINLIYGKEVFPSVPLI